MKKSTPFAILVAAIMMAGNVHVIAQCIECPGGVATGNASSVMGMNNSASGDYSFAGGVNSVASGGVSFAFGGSALAEGAYSVALGGLAKASYANSFAMGSFCTAEASNSFVIGTGVTDMLKITNTVPHSLVMGFGSTKPTFFIGPSNGWSSTGKIGIGDVTDPQSKLHIKADNNEAAEVFIEPHLFGGSYSATLWLGTKEYGIRARWGRLEFKVGNDGRYLFSDGYVGIGTTNPVAELQVNGDIFIEKDNAGLVLKSPDGQCWKITVDNTGELATTNINCNLTTDIEAKTPVENNIRIFPNPTSGELTIEAEQELSQGRVSIFSMEGRQLYSEPLHGITATIDLSHLQPGVYIVNVEGGGRLIKAQQVVVK
jgi:hypothetical protein